MRALLLSLLVATSAILIAPVRADAAAGIVAPASVATGWSGPVTVNAEESVTSVEVQISGPGYVWWDYAAREAGSLSPFVFKPDALTTGGRYDVSAYDGDTGALLSQATITARQPAPIIRNLRATPQKFFPVVRDGYLDQTAVKFTVNQDDARVRAQVVRVETGRTIRSAQVTGYTLAGFTEEWVWNGRAADGVAAKAGRYRITITATNGSGSSSRQSVVVTVAHGRFAGTMTYDFAGTRTDKRTKSKGCYLRGYGGELTLDCWGGRRAAVDYTFRVPRDAHELKWRVRGDVNCCDRGRIKKTGTRVSPTLFRIRVEVTGWRSFTIDSVYFKYSAKMLFRTGSTAGRG